LYTCFFTILLSLFLQKDPDFRIQKNGVVEIHFTNFAGAKILSPDSIYTNAFNETYSIGRLKYYITNIELINTESDTKAAIDNSYFLVDENEDTSKTISLSVPEGNYNAISFLLGVDSLHNVSGAQTGALDPMNGMFWTWNTGYVSIKIEGKSVASGLPGNFIEYHLGGFKGLDKVNHSTHLSFPKGSIKITQQKPVIIHVKADVNLFFRSVHSLPIKTNAACTSPGSLARQYSENYATIFSIIKVDQ
jgi:hypothetical protein